MGVVARNLTIDVYVVTLKILLDVSCRYCLEEDEVETSENFFLVCPAITRSRLKYLGSHTLRQLSWQEYKLNPKQTCVLHKGLTAFNPSLICYWNKL